MNSFVVNEHRVLGTTHYYDEHLNCIQFLFIVNNMTVAAIFLFIFKGTFYTFKCKDVKCSIQVILTYE